MNDPDHDRAASAYDHPAARDPARLEAECEIGFSRRSGPGGQNRNKVETAVVFTHLPTGLKSSASERRTQGENRRMALFRLRLELALVIRRPIVIGEEGGYRPSVLWCSRRKGGRMEVNPAHDDYPALLAEALDVLAVCEDEPRLASPILGCSPTQLVKLLKAVPRGLIVLNASREQGGKGPLR